LLRGTYHLNNVSTFYEKIRGVFHEEFYLTALVKAVAPFHVGNEFGRHNFGIVSRDVVPHHTKSDRKPLFVIGLRTKGRVDAEIHVLDGNC